MDTSRRKTRQVSSQEQKNKALAKKKEEEEKLRRAAQGPKPGDDDDEGVDDILAEYFGDTQNDEEPEGEDLYGSDIEQDYTLDPELDTYEAEDVDDSVRFTSFLLRQTCPHISMKGCTTNGRRNQTKSRSAAAKAACTRSK